MIIGQPIHLRNGVIERRCSTGSNRMNDDRASVGKDCIQVVYTVLTRIKL